MVCTLTGHGLKDPGVAEEQGLRLQTVEPTLDAIRDAVAAGIGAGKQAE